MISEKQLAANRRNALLSRGPVSTAGKRRVGLNNLRHGLTGQTTVLSEEERAAHDHFCADIISSLRPEGALELRMAQSIADDHWRLGQALSPKCVGNAERRGRNIFALGQLKAEADAAELPESDDVDAEIDAALNSARVFLADAGKFALLSLYEQRIHRNLQRSMTEFRSLQAARIQQSSAATEKPAQAETSAQPKNGVEFSNDLVQPPEGRREEKILPAYIGNPTESLISGLGTVG